MHFVLTDAIRGNAASPKKLGSGVVTYEQYKQETAEKEQAEFEKQLRERQFEAEKTLT